MTAARSCIQDFATANPIYASATIAFYTVVNGVRTETLATLYSSTTGSTTLSNPQQLDAHGKFKQPVYHGVAVVGVITNYTVTDHETGIIFPLDSNYFGALAADPATNPITAGALEAGNYYFNTATGKLKTYNGSSWYTPNLDATDLASTANALGASLIGIEDAASNFTATTVEGALAEVYTDLAASSGSSLVGFSHAVTYAAGTLGAKGRDIISVKDAPYNATGDGVADDYTALSAALTAIAAAGGGTLQGVPGETYRITAGLLVTTSGVIFDLNGATLLADFAAGWAFTSGDGVTVTNTVGIKNGKVTTTRPEATLNGVLYEKNVRRNIAHTNLYVTSFKGTGIKYQELNWSTQGAFNPLIEDCGVNLHIDDNTNALTVTGAHLKNADTYNAIIRGSFAVTFIGGGIENAGTAGVYIDNGLVGSLQASHAVNFYGVYFEDNGTHHIHAKNGKALCVEGSFVNGESLTGAAIKLESWSGASIKHNDVSNMTTGTTRDFVEADASCTLIEVNQNFATTPVDLSVCVYGGSKAGLIGIGSTTTPTLPTASTINRGNTVLYAPASGTDSTRSRPYMCMDIATASRAFVRLETAPRKQAAVGVTSPQTPNLGTTETFDWTVPSTGLTINAPTVPYADGDKITFLLRQNSVGGGGLTWDAAYKTNLTASGTANQFASVSFIWSAGRAIWVQVGKLEWS